QYLGSPAIRIYHGLWCDGSGVRRIRRRKKPTGEVGLGALRFPGPSKLGNRRAADVDCPRALCPRERVHRAAIARQRSLSVRVLYARSWAVDVLLFNFNNEESRYEWLLRNLFEHKRLAVEACS